MTNERDLVPLTRRELSRRAAAPTRAARPAVRLSARRGVLGTFAAFAAVAFAAGYVLPLTTSAPQAEAAELRPISLYASTVADAQAYIAASDTEEPAIDRGELGYTVYVKPTPTPTPTPVAGNTVSSSSSSSGSSSSWAPPFVTPDPGSAQATAYEMVTARGWGDDEFACLVALWKKESGWRVNAYNASSGAYGIPQALPGRKMASAGADWETSAATQISWGLGYISGRYSTPCGAWDHSQRKGWY